MLPGRWPLVECLRGARRCAGPGGARLPCVCACVRRQAPGSGIAAPAPRERGSGGRTLEGSLVQVGTTGLIPRDLSSQQGGPARPAPSTCCSVPVQSPGVWTASPEQDLPWGGWAQDVPGSQGNSAGFTTHPWEGAGPGAVGRCLATPFGVCRVPPPRCATGSSAQNGSALKREFSGGSYSAKRQPLPSPSEGSLSSGGMDQGSDTPARDYDGEVSGAWGRCPAFSCGGKAHRSGRRLRCPRGAQAPCAALRERGLCPQRPVRVCCALCLLAWAGGLCRQEKSHTRSWGSSGHPRPSCPWPVADAFLWAPQDSDSPRHSTASNSSNLSSPPSPASPRKTKSLSLESTDRGTWDP